MRKVQIVIVISLLAAAGPSLALEEYGLTIDPGHLDSLTSDPYSGRSYPALLVTAEGQSTCMVRLRGSYSLQFPKKSWAINIDDPDLIGRSRLNLMACYTDPTMMRNCLALRISEILGFPAPASRHVSYSINDEYMGVYLEVERIDDDLFSRLGLTVEARFKAEMEGARFPWVPSGVDLLQAYSPCDEGVMRTGELQRLIDALLSGEGEAPVDVRMVLSYYAVTLAVLDRDAAVNNYYLILCGDGLWRIIPWDREVSFGTDGSGVFFPEFIYQKHLSYLQLCPLFRTLMQDGSNRQEFTELLQEAASVMAVRVPDLVDSIRAEIEGDLLRDPFYQWSPCQFTSACEDMERFSVERAQMLLEDPPVPAVAPDCSINITPDRMSSSGGRVTVELHSDLPLRSCLLRYLVEEGFFNRFMTEVPGSGGRCWRTMVEVPPGVRSVPMSFSLTSVQEEPDAGCWYFPAYGFLVYDAMQTAHPSVLLTDLPELFPRQLRVLPPRRYGPNLWSLPIVNDSRVVMDLSLCRISLGDPPAFVFLDDSTVLGSGDTLHITNDLDAFRAEFPGVGISSGDCSLDSIGGTILRLDSPSWEPLAEMSVPAEESRLSGGSTDVEISEICPSAGYGQPSNDWIELYNGTTAPIDISGYHLRDGNGNSSTIPFGTTLPPSGFLVLPRDPDRFRLDHPGVGCGLVELCFDLDADADSLAMFSRSGERILSTGYIMKTPDRILSLLLPGLAPARSENWEELPHPGSPGMPNRTWLVLDPPAQLQLVWPNPTDGSGLGYRCSEAVLPARIFVMDLTGRMVASEAIGEGAETGWLELPQGLPDGVYFLVSSSAGLFSTMKFVILR